MKPKVGLTVLTSSFITFLTIVVLPALSKPLFSFYQLSSNTTRLNINDYESALRKAELTALEFSSPYPSAELFEESTTFLPAPVSSVGLI